MSTGLQNEHLPQTPTSSTSQQPTSADGTPTSPDISRQIISLLNNSDDKTLKEVMCHCQNVLNSRKKPRSVSLLDRQFSVLPNVLSVCNEPTTSNVAGTLLSSPRQDEPAGPDFLEKLTEELESLNLREKSGVPGNRKVASQWVISNPQQTNLPSEDMDNFPHICKLRTLLSHHLGGAEFNSCIVNFYADGAARTRPHSDDESYIDQNCPIACFSIGETREIGIFDKSNGQLVGKHELQEGSLLIMSPGAQANTKHQLLPKNFGLCGERHSISFRKINYTEVTNEWPFTDRPRAVTPKQTPPSSCKTTLILGTSIPYYLDFEKLSGTSGRVKVVNLCKRGAKISHLHEVLDEHFTNESSDVEVDKIILSVGTNDLRNNMKNTVGHLYIPLENLISKIKSYYPHAKIYIQSLLPQRVQNAFTVSNVLGFNKLLVKLAALNKCLYLDIFAEFLGENSHPHPALYRWDGVHLSNKGLSVLARAFISKIRGRYNPITRA